MARKIVDETEVIRRFTVDLERMQDIANDLGCTRQAVWYCLHRNGVLTPKVSQIEVSCALCGAIIKRTRQEVRDHKHLFCDYDCYHEWLEMGKGLDQDSRYIASKRGQIKARQVVSQYFELQEGNIVHHEDRNATNNDPRNLKVFACHGDHLRHHRGFRVPILWDGQWIKT